MLAVFFRVCCVILLLILNSKKISNIQDGMRQAIAQISGEVELGTGIPSDSECRLTEMRGHVFRLKLRGEVDLQAHLSEMLCLMLKLP